MKHYLLAILGISSLTAAVVLTYPCHVSAGPKDTPIAAPKNPAIDMQAFLQVAQEAAKYRESRRLTEDQFLRMSQEKSTIVLDARSKEKFDQLHIKGAINLSFPDITVESLARVLPDKSARILIYCNNNFKGTKYTQAGAAFETKMKSASLNLSTYIALYNYGYKNVYELGPLLDPDQCTLSFEPAVAKK